MDEDDDIALFARERRPVRRDGAWNSSFGRMVRSVTAKLRCKSGAPFGHSIFVTIWSLGTEMVKRSKFRVGERSAE